MASGSVQVQRGGLNSVFIDSVLLGYTRNGVDETAEGYWLDVPGDQNGGDDGPPVEVQYLGEIVRVRLELTKWDETVADAIRKRVLSATAGVSSTPGTLMFSQSKFVRLTCNSASDNDHDRNYPTAIPRMPIEQNRGTKYSTLVCEFECHAAAAGGGSVIYNETVS